MAADGTAEDCSVALRNIQLGAFAPTDPARPQLGGRPVSIRE